MEKIIQVVIIVLIGLYFLKYFLQKATINSIKKKNFINEYYKILNNPQNKVKKAIE